MQFSDACPPIEPRPLDNALRVACADADDVSFWAAVFDVTAPEIRYAVQSVGSDVAAVERFVRFAAANRPASLLQ